MAKIRGEVYSLRISLVNVGVGVVYPPSHSEMVRSYAFTSRKPDGVRVILYSICVILCCSEFRLGTCWSIARDIHPTFFPLVRIHPSSRHFRKMETCLPKH